MKKNKNTDSKNVFRRSKAWHTFRENIREKQKTDPVTGAKLSKNYNLHHLDLNADNYTDISDETHFVGLNSTTHSMIHYLFGDTRHRNDWRKRLIQLENLCILMEEINNDRQ